MPKMKNEEIRGILAQELAMAQGGDFDELETHREEALQYFKGDARGDEISGRSSIQSLDVSDMVEAILSEMLPSFTKETLISFEPSSEEDEEQADLESKFVQHMVERSGGYINISEAVKDALMMRNGILKVWVEEKRKVKRIKLESSTVEEFAAVTQPEDNVQIDINSFDEDEFGLISATVVKTIQMRELRVDAVPPENFLYSGEHDSILLDGIRAVNERWILTRTELKEMYPDKSALIDDLPALETTLDGASHRRKETNVGQELSAIDSTMAAIETWDTYILIDADGDGIAELQRIHWVDHEDGILMMEDAEWVPYASGSPFIWPHRFTGQSMHDKLKPVQDAKTFTLRQMLDNVNQANNTRWILNPNSVDVESFLNSRPGGVAFARDPNAAVPIQHNPIVGESVAVLDYLDKVRTERGGASLDMLNPSFQLAAKSVGDQGLDQQMTAKEKLVGMITRNLAETILKGMYMLVHKTLREYLPGQLTAKLNGNWAETDPSQWPERKHVMVNIGMTAGERREKAQALSILAQSQMAALQLGMDDELVTKANLYNTQIDWSRTTGLDFPEQYWTDPNSQEAQQAAQQKAQLQAQQQSSQEKLQYDLANAPNQLKAVEIMLSDKLDYFKEYVKMEIEEAKIIGSAEAGLMQAQQQAQVKSNEQQ